MQICDDTNQATGFAILGTTVGISRIVVSKTNHRIENGICITLLLHSFVTTLVSQQARKNTSST